MKCLLVFILMLGYFPTVGQSNKNNLGLISPLSFIDSIKVRSSKEYLFRLNFFNFPTILVKKEHIDSLIRIIKSPEICKCYVSTLSSYIPSDSATVGGYATEFINSYRFNKKIDFGLYACPKTDKNRADEIIEWWNHEKNNTSILHRKTDWTVPEVKEWVEKNSQYSTWKGWLLYQGSDSLKHHFITRGTMDDFVQFNIERTELTLQDIRYYTQSSSAPFGYYYVDPLKDFSKIKNYK